MLFDASAVPGEQQIDTDVCIIGSGPAGISIAREFIGEGTRVCVLESGGKGIERRPQRLSRGESVGYSTFRLHTARVRAFGGTSMHWPLGDGWRARPLDPIDFETRPGVPYSGWPFDRAHLEPYYEQAQSVCQLGPWDYDADRWAHAEHRPPLPLSTGGVRTTLFQLGSATFEGYYEELVRAPNINLVLHATVAELATEGDGSRVDRVEVRRDDGSRFFVAPRIVVLAAGGIENPRLLLLSRRVHTRGLGNRHDLVGRFFAERLSARTGYIVPTDADVVRRAGFYDDHVVDGTRLQGSIQLDETLVRERQLLNCTFFVLPRSRSMTAEAVRSLATLVKGFDRRPWPEQSFGHVRNIATGLADLSGLVVERVRRSGADGVLVLRAQAEQAPNRDSRVRLGERRDRLGLPVARLDWRMAASDRASIRASQAVVDAELRRAGLGRVEFMLGDESPPALFEGNRHHLGTTRMHSDPKQGVVDANCQVHDVHNLFVAGSSVFPTYGCSNPTLTIVALALRLAGHLKKELAGMEVS